MHSIGVFAHDGKFSAAFRHRATAFEHLKYISIGVEFFFALHLHANRYIQNGKMFIVIIMLLVANRVLFTPFTVHSSSEAKGLNKTNLFIGFAVSFCTFISFARRRVSEQEKKRENALSLYVVLTVHFANVS